MDDDLGAALGFCALLCGAALWTSWDSDNIVGHLRHQIAYGVSYSNVHMQSRPKDCDFWGAPVGMKDCRYEPVVTAYNSAGEVIPGNEVKHSLDRNTGQPIISYDDGETWVWAPAISDYTVKRVEVQWRKATD